jgi:hypothetical protein
MNRSSCLRMTRLTHRVKTRSCRNLVVPSRVRRQLMAENFDKAWLELRQRATVETDQKKLLQLATRLEKK